MATTADTASPPPPPFALSTNRSPDTVSSIFPDRAIRPLPKTRLLSRLSPEQAASIDFSKHRKAPQLPPTFGAPEVVATADEPQQENRVPNGHAQYLHHHPSAHHDASAHTHCTCGEELDSGDDEVEFDHPDYRYATPTPAAVGGDKTLDTVQRRLMETARVPAKPPPPPGSAASSADGYESFENTSNKKKRKIPLSGTGTNQSQLSAEMASMGISGGVDGASDDISTASVAVQQEYIPPPASAGKGISGAGRGRYGRGEARRPLASSNINLSNGWTRVASGSDAGLRAGVKSTVKSGADAGIENTGGIISQAIKSAAQQGPLTPQNKTSLLRAVQNTTPTPGNPKTQFTFTMESESANKFIENQAQAQQEAAQRAATYANPRASAGKAGPATMSNQGTQTTQPLRNGTSNPGGSGNTRPPPPPNHGNNSAGPPPPVDQPPTPQRKPRRNPAKEYALAARQRRLQQEYANYHHRPSRKDSNIWICEFCEYEDIFGVPPLALIRQYEIKDRIERKKAEEKRRLLEKAKAKGRKGRKGSKKNSHNNANKATDPLTGAASAAGAGGQAYDPTLLPDGVEGDEYYPDDDYDGEFGPPDGVYGDEYDPAEYELQEQERALRAEAARKLPPAARRGGKAVK